MAEDVRRALSARPKAGIPLNNMRRIIARRMSQSHTEIPPVTTCVKVDVTELLALRERLNEGREKKDKLSVNDFVIRATALALKNHERFRMTYEESSYLLHEEIHIGMAVGLDDGLIVPALRDVDKKTLDEISAMSKDVAGRARKGQLKPEEFGDCRITVSNLGMFGTYCFTPIINQPEASIIGVCDIEDELALNAGQLEIRKKTILCTTYDHRIINGVEASRFQADLKKLLEQPETLL